MANSLEDCRSALLAGPLSPDTGLHRIAASGIAGSCAGAVAAAFLPRGSFVSGSIMLGIIAAASQAGINTIDNSSPTPALSSRFKQKLLGLIPMKSLTDDEYAHLLQDKLLKLEAEISILDDQIATLRAASKQQAQGQTGRSKNATS
ncbi:hypothetical protein A1O3_05015 [Capronia epimyces CBS 606.96]|uniref:Uncharacterized protein n=1 Tax=Capronia epimyces CBS 606.96 TaxID=1182542 RepID=W9XVW6_9EURO|nr:uncharacterized protein A1O3_05015 [Capronia epimyces CBS 606.96]EXJ84348.1 hypothetical protein A1O3_05015 [Capronia epimyces CBS 606.96]